MYGRCIVLNSNGDLYSEEAGPRKGIELILNVEKAEHIGIASLSGVRLAIHDPTKLPIVEEDGLDLAPGFAASVVMTAVSL